MKNERKKIVILDYKTGNITSLTNILDGININYKVSKNEKDLKYADIIILPGVGNFGKAINEIKKKKFKIFFTKILKKKKILGICLGMQILCDFSEEFKNEKGMGIFKCNVQKLNKTNVGWRKIFTFKNKSLFKKFNNYYFYFNHSYGITNYKNHCESYIKEMFPCNAIIKNKNIIGVQFHPEKSQQSGIKFLKEIISNDKYFN